MGIRVDGVVEKVNGREITYNEFVNRFMEANQPVVFTDLMDGWMASNDWVTTEGYPHLIFFSTYFGDSIVQVAKCGVKELNDQQRMEMPVSVFIDQWSDDSVKEENNSTLLYLKDWHFTKEYPKYTAYTTPLLFCDDWLNMYLDNYDMHEEPESPTESKGVCCSDYRFVYMGKKGTWTPLHADVFRSYSWSANVSGKKRWLFLPPSQSHLVFDRNMKNTVYDIFEDIDEKRFPGFEKSIWLECIQEKDEIIFVPSGWYHQVHNLEDTISINHNWFNGHNISWIWELLVKDHNEAKEYIEDVRDMCEDFEAVCQRNLAANSGMNFKDFFLFVVRFTLAVLVILETGPCRVEAVRRHLAENLVHIRKVMSKMDLSSSFLSFSVDVKAALLHPGFTGLVRDMTRTYGMIHGDDVMFGICVFGSLEKRFGNAVTGPGGIVRLVDMCLVEFVW